MSEDAQDELWPHFVPIWTDLRKIAPGLLLAGGYGLFLKQQWLVSQDVSKSPEVRDLESRQARKHAEDVFRIVAMMTLEERETANEVLKVVRDNSAYSVAATTYLRFFNGGESWGSLAVEEKWQPEDFQMMKSALATWLA